MWKCGLRTGTYGPACQMCGSRALFTGVDLLYLHVHVQ